MDDSILTTAKSVIEGLTDLDESDNVFDTSLIIYINSAFGILRQLGVGPKEGFRVKNSNTTWSEFNLSDDNLLESVKEYICLKVKLKFDPPSSSALIEAIKESIEEHEFRFSIKDSFV